VVIVTNTRRLVGSLASPLGTYRAIRAISDELR